MPADLPPELSAGLDLPAFTDRLPDLGLALRSAARELEKPALNQSYLPYWEDIYQVAHSLKGVMHILSCPPDLETFMVELNAALLGGIAGPLVCRDLKAAGIAFTALSDALDQTPLPGPAFYTPWMRQFRGLYGEDIEHEARMGAVPTHLVYVNEQVSKKAREIVLLKLNQCVVEDEILLDQIPLWRTQLNEALMSPDWGRGLVVNFLPFISSEGSQTLKVWAWVAAASHSRAALKSRIKEVMPKVMISSV